MHIAIHSSLITILFMILFMRATEDEIAIRRSRSNTKYLTHVEEMYKITLPVSN